MLMVEVLEEAGYIVVEAGDSVAGLKILQSDIRIDLLITDVGLPGGMNGRQLAEAARATRPDLKVLFNNQICRECRRWTWASRPRNADDGKALCHGGIGE